MYKKSRKDIKKIIAQTVRDVSEGLGYERGAVAAVDMMMQWEESYDLLCKTIDVWTERVREVNDSEHDGCFTDTERHGAYVPAIPL